MTVRQVLLKSGQGVPWTHEDKSMMLSYVKHNDRELRWWLEKIIAHPDRYTNLVKGVTECLLLVMQPEDDDEEEWSSESCDPDDEWDSVENEADGFCTEVDYDEENEQ